MSEPTPRRQPPLSIRLTFAERAHLEQKAGDRSLSSYIKAAVFAGEPGLGLGASSRRVSHQDALLARILAKLGTSDLAASMARMAEASDTGSLFVDDQLTKRLHEACDDIRDMRDLLMEALGKRRKEAEPKPHTLSDHFRLAATGSVLPSTYQVPQ